MPLPAAGAALALIQQAGSAIGGMVDQIKKLPDAVRPFVDAFSNAGDRLDAAYKSLYSTIGYALEPIIIAASTTVERFADALSSGMNLLRGPIEKAAGLFTGSLKPVMEGIAAAGERLGRLFEKLSPLLTPLGAALEAVGGLAHVLSTIFGELVLGIVDRLMPSGKSLADLTDKVGEAFVFLASTTLRLADFFLTMIGMEDRMRPILEALAQEHKAGGRRQPKPEGYGISGVEDVYRKRLLAAAGAGGRSVQDESRDYLKELRDLAKQQLEELKNRPEDREAKREGTEQAVKNSAATAGGFGAGVAVLLAWLKDRQDKRNSP